ncbi:sterol desaturase family protein [Dokdonella sp.]|uniref:sterol desaturase family protein n=1 Tax=Dokdonella sp. TaxID=2291710 RepID=UPI003783CCDC
MNLPSTLLGALRQFVGQTPLILWAIAIAVFTAAELVARQPVPWHRRVVNLVNGLVVLLVIFVAGPLVAGTLHWLQGSLGYKPLFLLDRYVPFAPLAALVFLLAYDLGYYWFHRWQHASSLLWRVHAVHHSETDLNATSYVRQHFLENVVQSFAVLVPLLMVVPIMPRTLAWVALISAMVQFFAHAALPIHFGPLSALLISPRLHRIHHSTDRAESDSNYASMFPLWDVVFRTYRSPSPRPERTGLHSGERLPGLWPLLSSPFRRRPATMA